MSAIKLAAPKLLPTTIALPDHDGQARFLASIPDTVARSGRLGIALSGGPDSVALLLLAVAALPGQVEAATVDHQLRDDAREEALWCAALCDQLGVAHQILTPSAPITGNLQAEARRARYALLDAWAEDRELDWIATAHHADDQAETLMMRLNRGSGVAGLAGIRAVNGKRLRPLLHWRRSELTAVVAQAGLTACDDPSNRDDDFTRVKIRTALAEAPWLDTASVAQSVTHLAEAETALCWTTDQLVKTHLSCGSDGKSVTITALPSDLPKELRRRVVHNALHHLQPGINPRGDALDNVLNQMARGEKAMIGDLLITPLNPADSSDAAWLIIPAPPRHQKG